MERTIFVIQISQRLEQLLKNEFGARGRGLGELTRSIQHELPSYISNKLKKISSVRNKVIHEGALIPDYEGFRYLCLETERELQDIAQISEPQNLQDDSLYETEGSAEFEAIWVDHNVYRFGEIGMLIHVEFVVYNLQNVNCRATAYFSFQDGDYLIDFNNNYCDTDGVVCVSEDFTPAYEETYYDDLELFIPNSEFHLTDSENDLVFVISLYDYDMEEIFADSEEQFFQWQQHASDRY